jgi:hypothetical protein
VDDSLEQGMLHTEICKLCHSVNLCCQIGMYGICAMGFAGVAIFVSQPAAIGLALTGAACYLFLMWQWLNHGGFTRSNSRTP